MVEKKKILGYFNANKFYPAPLTIVLETGDEKFLTYPDGYVIKYEGDLNHGDFVRELTDKYLGDNEFAYGVSRDRIFVGNSDYILRSLADVIKEGNLSEVSLKSIKDFIDDSC